MDDGKLRVLLVEDSESDARQVARLLKAAPDNRFILSTVNRLQSAHENANQ